MANILTEPIAARYFVVPYLFSLANLVASQTDTDLGIIVTGTAAADVLTAKQHIMPYAGQIVALTAKLDAAMTAGVLTLDIERAGTEIGLDKSIATAATTEYTWTFAYGAYPVTANSLLGVTYTSDANLAPVTSDIVVTVYVMFSAEF